MILPPPILTLFPYTTLFRSHGRRRLPHHPPAHVPGAGDGGGDRRDLRRAGCAVPGHLGRPALRGGLDRAPGHPTVLAGILADPSPEGRGVGRDARSERAR